jgi:transposase InsO family protein/transposase-like protein
MSKTSNKYSPEVRERAVRLVLDNSGQHESRLAAIVSISSKISCAPQMLNEWVKKAEVDAGQRGGMTTEQAEKEGPGTRGSRVEAGQRDPLQGVRIFCAGGARPPIQTMIRFVEDHRADHGVEPICRVLPIAPATFYDHLAKRADPSRLSDRAKRDEDLKPEIERVFEENFSVYGVRKTWHQMHREGFDIARCKVARLMKDIGIERVVRGKKPKTTIPDKALPCLLDKVNRQFHAPAPNMLWVSDFTYVAKWQGFVYVDCVIDVFARRIVGWRVSRTATAGFVLDALDQAIHQRRPAQDQLVHHSDRGSQYLSIKYTERLAEARVAPSVGSVGDSYDNALAETINGLFKAEVIHRRGPWRSFDAVEYATLEWGDWFNNRRLLEPIGNIPPAKAEANFYAALEKSEMAA